MISKGPLADTYDVGSLPKRDFPFRVQLTRKQHFGFELLDIEIVGQVDGQRSHGSLALV